MKTGIVYLFRGLALMLFSASLQFGDVFAVAQTGNQPAQEAPTGTSTDLFVMFGSDFDRPGLLPRVNDNIGIGRTFGFLKKDPLGDELTFAYTYENAGTHGFYTRILESIQKPAA